VDPLGLAPKSPQQNCDCSKLSSPNPVRRELREAYEDIKTGGGIPRLDENGKQKIFQGRENQKWAGALEYEVRGKNGEAHRILKKVLSDGREILGYAENHDYSHIKLFPAPWYPDGG
jgi:hypothetical protein